MKRKIVCVVVIGIFLLLSLNFASAESEKDLEPEKNTALTNFEVYVYRFGLFQNYLQNVDELTFNKIFGDRDTVYDVSGNGYTKYVKPGLYVISVKANVNGITYRGLAIANIHLLETKEVYIMVSPTLI